MPVLMAILINNVPPSARTTANSIANFVYNLLGYLPAPYVYGLVYDLTGSGDSRWGLFALECSGIFAVLVMVALLIKQRRDARLVKEGR